MKKTKVENISDIKLEFFLKQDKEDIRVVLKPGEHTWCDWGTTTKSMILYERKKLIKTSTETEQNLFHPIELLKNTKPLPIEEILLLKNASNETIANELIPISSIPSSLDSLIVFDDISTKLEQALKETEEYKQESEKKYTGKKRGRKKKRGPKPGAKKKAAKKAKKDGGNDSITGTNEQ